MSSKPFGLAFRERLNKTVVAAREAAQSAQTALSNLDAGSLVNATLPPREPDAGPGEEEVCACPRGAVHKPLLTSA